MSEPLSIKLFLCKGSSSGLRTAEISNWSGKAVACSRAELDKLSRREEANRPGVYILIGNDTETDEPAAYVGEAEEVGKRLKQHLGKEFWNQVIAFVSKDENLTKAHIKYLEGKLIELGLSVGKGVILNGQNSGARLPESDQAEMDIFLDRLLKILPILGTNLFSRIMKESLSEDDQLDTLICKIKGLAAQGQRTENGFVVLKGSQAVLEPRKSAKRARVHREELVEKAILQQSGDHYVFTRDYEFSSPSRAATMVRGGNSNGLACWKSKDGRSLKELEEA